MRFEDELVSPSAIKIARDKEPRPREIAMARSLVEQMSEKWDPRRYTDEYKSALMKLIDRKIAAGGKSLPRAAKPRRGPTNVIDLAAVLQESLAEAGGKGRPPGGTKPAKAKGRRRAA